MKFLGENKVPQYINEKDDKTLSGFIVFFIDILRGRLEIQLSILFHIYFITVKIIKMKNIYLAILFLIVLGCREKKVEPVLGTISSLQFDGKPIQRVGTRLEISAFDITSRCNISQYAIQLSLISHNDTLVETLYIGDIPKSKTGIITLTKASGTCDSLPDVGFTMDRYSSFLVAAYEPLKKFDNYINIQSFDTKINEVKGRFKLTLVNDSYSQYPKQFGYRDTIVLDGGEFTVRLH
jgi:hypothetical protein